VVIFIAILSAIIQPLYMQSADIDQTNIHSGDT